MIAGPESNFQLTIVIDRGSAAGILKGMPVVAGGGLVGRVMEASNNQSTVLLATDTSESVGVYSSRTSRSTGVAWEKGPATRWT